MINPMKNPLLKKIFSGLVLITLVTGHAFAQKPGNFPPNGGRFDAAGQATGIEACIQSGDAIRFEQLSMEFLGRGKQNALQYMEMQRRFTERWGDQKGFMRRTEAMVSRYAMGDASLLNNAAWHVYEIVADRHGLHTALDWAEESIFLDPAYYNHDTYAMIAGKLGQRRKAVISARTAIMIAKMRGEDCYETEVALASLLNGGICSR